MDSFLIPVANKLHMGEESEEYANENYLTNTEVLLRSILFSRGRLLDRRKDIRISLVLAGVDSFEENCEFTVSNLAKKIAHISKCTLTDREVLSLLDDEEIRGFVKHVGSLTYVKSKSVDFPGFDHLSQPVWEEFIVLLHQKDKDYDPHIHKNARSVFDAILMAIVARFSLSKPLENHIDYLPIEDIKSVINHEIGKIPFPDNFPKKYSDTIMEYVCSTSPVLLKFILDCYYCFIDIDLVTKESYHKDVDFCETIGFLLVDTNFVVPLLCETDPLHPLSFSVFEYCKKTGVKLYYSPKTKGEIWNLVNGSKNEMRLNIERTNSHENQFLNDYRNLKRRSYLHWSDYIVYLNNWVDNLKSKYSIEQLPEECELEINDHVFNQVTITLPMLDGVKAKEQSKYDPTYQVKKRSPNQLAHDAFCVALICSIKEKNRKSGSGLLGPWFLTYDNLLSNLNSYYFMQTDEYGYVIQPRTLLNYYLAYSKIKFDEKDLEYLAMALLRYTARAKQSKLSLEEYSQELAVKIGASEDDADSLYEFLKRSPLLSVLEEALDEGQTSEADRIAVETVSHPNFDRLIQSFEEMQGDKVRIKELGKRLKKVSNELDIERAKRETLEKATSRSQVIVISTAFNSDISLEVQGKVTELIEKLNEINAIGPDKISSPPKQMSKKTLTSWLKSINFAIETKRNVLDGIVTVTPLISQIMRLLS